MNQEHHRERLSALLDDEASELEVRQLLRDVSEEDLARFARYQQTRDRIKPANHGPHVRVPTDFNARLGAALDGVSQQGRYSLLETLTRSAVAATVALGMVLGWQFIDRDMTTQAPQLAERQAAPASGALTRPFAQPELVARALPAWSVPSGDTPAVAPLQSENDLAANRVNQARLDAMMVRHSEYAASHSSQNMMPYVRFVSQDARAGR